MMLEGWRWYGPDDPVSLDDVRQAGATDIVSALHQVPIGEAWTRKAVEERKNFIEHGQPGRSQLTWSVVESIPIPDDVKRLGAKATASIDAWIASLEAVAAAGIKIICYNFMPVVDWCRTDLEWELPNGARAMRFDQDRFAAFELHILKRPAAVQEYSPEQQARAKKLFDQMSQADIDYLVMVIASALPGSTTEPMTIPQFRDRLETYRDITPKILRQHLAEFLGRVTPVAEQLGVSLTLHPDDPPRPLFGPAAHCLHRRRLSGAVRRRAVQGERHLPVHRLARRARRERSARDGRALRPAHCVCPSARDQARGRRPVILRVRSSRWRRRHGRGAEGAVEGERTAFARQENRVPSRPRPSYARRSRRNQAHQSRLHRDRTPARPRRAPRRDQGDRASIGDRRRHQARDRRDGDR
ncbi:hypothetical protein ACVWZR_005821 [Bradyrhizobium sp. i1.3.1]